METEKLQADKTKMEINMSSIALIRINDDFTIDCDC